MLCVEPILRVIVSRRPDPVKLVAVLLRNAVRTLLYHTEVSFVKPHSCLS